MPVTFTGRAPAPGQPSAPAPEAKPPEAPNGATAQSKAPPAPQQPLPTDRITFDKQLKLLRAYVSASDGGAKAATNEEVGAVVEMKGSTVSLGNAFFVKNGFLIRSGRGYIPSKEVLEYKLAHDWDAATAGSKLAPLIERTWFWQVLKPKLGLRPIDEGEALNDLALKIGARPEYKNQIKTLLDYLLLAGSILREGTTLTLVRRRPGETAYEAPPAEERASSPPPPKSQDEAAPDLAALPFGQVGSIKFAVSINVDMTQMVQWDPHRISAFFTGLAQVIAAQKGGKQP